MLPTIRPATPDHIPGIVAIERKATTAAHWPAHEYQKLLNSGVVLVCEQSGTICGFVCAKVVADECELENIVVAAEFLRQGIGSDLLRALITQANKFEASRIILEVRESNQAARRLYEKHGFRQVGRRPAYYNNPPEDAILYEYGSVPE